MKRLELNKDELGRVMGMPRVQEGDPKLKWYAKLGRPAVMTVVFFNFGRNWDHGVQIASDIHNKARGKTLAIGVHAIPDYARRNSHDAINSVVVSLASKGHRNTGYSEPFRVDLGKMPAIPLAMMADHVSDQASIPVEKLSTHGILNLVMAQDERGASLVGAPIGEIGGGAAFMLENVDLKTGELQWGQITEPILQDSKKFS